ncbi:hypothetical protein CcaverHIS631_0101620 [Cutaneotrichosporon cavernicola]|nr:hypothetical protein CcaverHIS631_0101620 [Cutaneotrichosporon cavernicola]BEJ02986.1 hypothetical protein CcaverHIS641_0101610 [Cutaneotrichosporon cavernicola]
MLGPRLCALGKWKGVLHAAPRGLTPRLVRYYTPSDAPSGAVGDKPVATELPDFPAKTPKTWREKSKPIKGGRRRGAAARGPNALSGPPSSLGANASSVEPKRSPSKEGSFKPKPWLNPSAGDKRQTDRPHGFGLEPSKHELPSRTVAGRVKQAKTIAWQHDKFFKAHSRSIDYLEKSSERRDRETAATYRKSLASMAGRLEVILDSLEKDMPPAEFEKLTGTLGRAREQQNLSRASRAEGQYPEDLRYRQASPHVAPLSNATTTRPKSVALLRFEAARKWALTAQRQAERTARLATLNGATEEAKNKANVFASAAAMAMEDFQDMREQLKDVLSPAELRDIEDTVDEYDSTNLSIQEDKEVVASTTSQYFRRDGRFESEIDGDLSASDFPVRPIAPPRENNVARLANNLQRVLFSPGVHYARDPRTGVWNFPPELANIPTPEEFNFDTLPDYITASKDPELADLAQGDGIKYSGSTSTLTSSFSQIWLTLNGGQGVDISKLSQGYSARNADYTHGAQLPAAIVMWPQPNGRYAIDSDKRFQTSNNILSEYGNILEKILTTDASEWWKSLKNVPEGFTPPGKPTAREAYAYSRGGKVLMRSQLDCQDNRLPGSGTFDIKTRAAMPIRHDRANWEAHKVYDISETLGQTATFERETFDLTRSGMLKYCFQARIGDMDGIFIAYHNTARCFGFEYMPRAELDTRLFGGPDIGDQVFQLCIGFFERIMDLVTRMFPDQAVSVMWFQAQPPLSAFQKARMDTRTASELTVVVQPFGWKGEGLAPTRAMRIQMVNNVDGKDVSPSQGIKFFSDSKEERAKQKWTVRYNIAMTPDTPEGHDAARTLRSDGAQRLAAMNAICVPEGKTPADMYDSKKRSPVETETAEALGHGTPSLEGPSSDATASSPATSGAASAVPAAAGYDDLDYATIKWVEPNSRIIKLRALSYETGKAYDERAAKWNAQIQQMKATDPEPEVQLEPYVIPGYEFQPTQWRERKSDPPLPVSATEKEMEEFAETASSREQEEDVAVDLDASEEAETSPDKFKRDRPPHYLA